MMVDIIIEVINENVKEARRIHYICGTIEKGEVEERGVRISIEEKLKRYLKYPEVCPEIGSKPSVISIL